MAHYSSWPSRLYCERPLDRGRLLAEAVADAADRIPRVLGLPPFRVYLGDKSPAAVDVGDVVLVGRLLDDLRRHGRPFIVANDARTWTLLLAVQESPHDGIQSLDLSLPGARQPQLGDLDSMVDLVRGAASGFEAAVGFIEDTALSLSYAKDRGQRASLTNLPPEARPYVDVSPGYEPIPGVIDRLPELRLASEFDRHRVPPGVYWINRWSHEMVATLGPERIRSAGWFRLEEDADGGMTAVATPTPPDLGDVGDVVRLAGLVAQLGLREVQDRHVGPRALD